MSTIDTDRLDRLLLRIEADAHRLGWDGQARLFALDDSTVPGSEPMSLPSAGRPVVSDGYIATDTVPPRALNPIASTAVFTLARNLSMAHPLVDAVLTVLRRPGFLGLALLYEGWGNTMTPEERKALGGRRLEDVPGSVECRMVTAATVDGRIHQVDRVRGEQPRLFDPTLTLEGAIPESLRTIVAVIAGEPVPEWHNTPSRWS